MELTRRQEEFIRNLVELSQKMDGPIHYSLLAERLGVSPFTAYDMLRLLEEKGVVCSEYQLASDKSGPGRAERVFSPTEAALEWRGRLSAAANGDIKRMIFERVQSGEFEDQELLDELLARIPPAGRGQITYCIEVMTIVALRLQHCSARRILQKYLPEILPVSIPANRANLSLLGGFTFGILSTECYSDEEWLANLFEHVSKYLQIVASMSPVDCRILGENMQAVFTFDQMEMELGKSD